MLTARQYRIIHGIRSIDDCQCASEEYICGFIQDNEQLDLFEDYGDDADLGRRPKLYFNELEKTEIKS